MLAMLLTLAVAAPAAEAANEGLRTVTVAVYTKKAAPVENLDPSELQIKENGKKRTVVSLEPDRRPLDVALILDSSLSMGPRYRRDLVEAAIGFWKALPEEARISAWTSGGAPSKIVDFGSDIAEGERALQMVAPGGKNYTLDAIMDASRDLRSERAARRFVVVVTYTDLEASRTLIQRTYKVIARTRVTPMVVLVKAGANPAQNWDTETIVEQMTKGYGGAHWTILTPMAATNILRRAAADLAGQYRLRYSSDSDKPTCPEVKVERKGVEVRAGLSQATRTVRRTTSRTARLETR
jgi:hypothetical protein